jgi:hypothetical protein
VPELLDALGSRGRAAAAWPRLVASIAAVLPPKTPLGKGLGYLDRPSPRLDPIIANRDGSPALSEELGDTGEHRLHFRIVP